MQGTANRGSVLSPFIVGAAAVCLASAGTPPDRPIRYTSLIDEEHALYHIVKADMSSGSVKAETLFEPNLTPFWSFIGKSQPAAAITGTFFAWENEKPVGDVLVNGVLKWQGFRGSVVAIDWFGKAHIFDSEFRKPVDWYPYRHALRGTVRVVTNGVVKPNPKAQHFRDGRLWSKAARTSIGVTKTGDLVLLATSNKVTLTQLGNAMKEMGVHDGISLDGGGSTMLYYRGAQLIPTHRKLSTMFVLHEYSPLDRTYETHLEGIAKEQRTGSLEAVFDLALGAEKGSAVD
jgi:hypothetical protein